MKTKVTLADVARAAGVSVSTASVVFSGAVPVTPDTKQRVRDAAQALGYRGPDPLAASLRRGRSGVVGVVFGGQLRSAFLDPVTSPTLDGLADALAPSGSGILLLRDDVQATGPALDSVALDAVVIMGSVPGQSAALDTLRARAVPIVAIEGDDIPGAVRIDIDSYDAQREVAEHVHALGHRDVAVVMLPPHPGASTALLGTASSVAPSDLVSRERLSAVASVFPQARVVSAHHSGIDVGADAAAIILAMQPRPTAVLAQSDLLAAGVLHAAREAGLRVPEDISITGFDGIAVDGIAPYVLTTAQQPANAKGRAAGDAILRMLSGTPVDSQRLHCTFRPGNTTAPPLA